MNNLVDGNIYVAIDENNDMQVAIQQNDLTRAVVGLYNPVTVGSLSDIANVDTTNTQNGSVLVFKSATSKWTATTTLDAQNMEGGEY